MFEDELREWLGQSGAAPAGDGGSLSAPAPAPASALAPPALRGELVRPDGVSRPSFQLHESMGSPERWHFGAQLKVLPPGLPLDPVSVTALAAVTATVRQQSAALAAAGQQLAALYRDSEDGPPVDPARLPSSELFAAGVYPVPADAVRECELLLRAVSALHTQLVAGLAAGRPPADGQVDAGASWDPGVSEFAADEAAALLELHSRTTASRMLQATTTAADAPQLLAAASEGLIPPAGVAAVTSQTKMLRHPADRAAAVDIVLKRARASAAAGGLVTPGRLTGWARAAVIELDPEAADHWARQAQAGRGVYLRPEEDAMARLEISDRADRTLMSWALIDQLARTAAPLAGADPAIDCARRHPDRPAAEDKSGGTAVGAAPDAPHDCRTLAAKRADALRFLLTTHPLVTGQHFPLHLLDATVQAPDTGVRDSNSGPQARGGRCGSAAPATAPSSADSVVDDCGSHIDVGDCGSNVGGGDCGSQMDGSDFGCNVDAADLARLLDAPTPLWRSRRVLVEVTVPVTTLTGQADAAGVLAGYGEIPPGLAAQIAAESVWQRLLTDPATGAVLDVGTSRYRPTAAIASFVTSRDRTCRCGCGQAARRCDLDHTIPFPQGPTAAGNLAPLERHGHRRKQHPSWRLVRRQDTYYWTTPAGDSFTLTPDAVGPILQALTRHADQPVLTLTDAEPAAEDGLPPHVDPPEPNASGATETSEPE